MSSESLVTEVDEKGWWSARAQMVRNWIEVGRS